MIERKLKDIGLSEKEISVYLCVLQYQKILPARVATLTSINRPTVYSVGKELIKRGLISEDIAGTAKYFVSLGEDVLQNIIEQQEEKVFELKKKIPSIIQELKILPKQGKYSVPKIRFIDEFRLKEFLIKQSPIWAKSGLGADGIWWGFQDHTLLEQYPEWPEYFWNKYSKDISMNLFTNEKTIETSVMSKKSYSVKRNMKYWDANSEFSTTHVVIGNYVLMIMTREEPHYLIEIYDHMVAENTRLLFRKMWNMK